MNISDLQATSPGAKSAEARLTARVQKGAHEQQQAIQAVVSTVIVDRYYYPEKMDFLVDGTAVKLTYAEESGKIYHIYNHAMGQMASIVDMPRKYASKLREGDFQGPHGTWTQELLAHNFNELFHKGAFETARGKKIKYLRRAVGDEIRGFQGANYKRSLATAPLLRAFIEQCAKHNAAPVEAVTTAVKTILKCMMPYVFEPVDGEFVALGATFLNSDFGAARTGVSTTVMRINSGTISVMEDSFSKVHLGKAVEADDESDLTISDETLRKELETHVSAIRDVVDGSMSYAAVDRTLKAIEAASTHGIEWYRLRTALSKVLAKKEIDLVKSLLDQGTDDMMDLPPLATNSKGDPMATSWWAANVVGWMASKETNEDKKQDMQKLAGSLVAA